MTATLAFLAALLLAGAEPDPAAQTNQPAPNAFPETWDGARYVPDPPDELLEQMEKNAKDARHARTQSRLDAEKKAADEKEKRERERKALLASLPQDQIPESVEAFKAPFFFPPVAQYMTGTCWSFSGTSFLESEVQRISGVKMKLSEMFTVYWEYVEKARRFVQQRGISAFEEGSLADGVTRTWRQYGAVPLEVYTGVLAEDGRHDHQELMREMKAYLAFVKSNDLWDEDAVIQQIRAILDRHLGRPPERFRQAGKDWTPLDYMRRHLKVDPDAYVTLISTTSLPFWKPGLHDVQDNWRRSTDYLNLPLDDFYGALFAATAAGFTAVYGGDVSEPGKYALEDIAFIPDFDIPSAAINQDAREYRIYEGITTDDHGVHVLGKASRGGHDWFLIKDSGRSARKGRFEGFYFFRDDFIRLKMLSVTLHRDALSKELQQKLGLPEPARSE